MKKIISIILASICLISQAQTFNVNNLAVGGMVTSVTPFPVAAGGTGTASLTGLTLGNGTSAFSAYGGTSCTNQFPRSLNASGSATCATVSLTADVTGIAPTANGGTGIAFFTAAGPTVARVYTFPDAAATILYSGGALGTPSSGVATNLTGTASGLTAGNVTTNANLTGPVTSVGNATTIGSGQVILANLATQATNTIVGNATSGTASPTALAVGTCSTSSSALNWTTNTGFGCNTNIAANTVTTNANLTGPITSTGNATAVAAQTGTGSTFVMQASPTITTPVINGVTNASAATSGQVGEILSMSATVGLTSATSTNITSITLTAGDWLVFGNIEFDPAASTVANVSFAGVSSTSATLPAAPLRSSIGANQITGSAYSAIAPMTHFNVSSSTPLYLVGYATFSISTLSANGYITAIRIH